MPSTTKPTPETPGYSQDGHETGDGGVLTWPDADGTINFLDEDGDEVNSWTVDDPSWPQFAAHFGVTVEDFAGEDN